MTHPLPKDTRVHHRGVVWSRQFVSGQGWATVLRSIKQADGTYEYEVQRDEPLQPDWPNYPTWWASYHIDRHILPIEEKRRNRALIEDGPAVSTRPPQGPPSDFDPDTALARKARDAM